MITETEIEKIAKLASLKLTPEQVKQFSLEVSSILEFINNLAKCDTTNVSPTSHVHGSTNFFRDDLVKPSMPIEVGLKNAPDRSGRFIRVPIIIDQNVEH